jgi:hypothetical protein
MSASVFRCAKEACVASEKSVSLNPFFSPARCNIDPLRLTLFRCLALFLDWIGRKQRATAVSVRFEHDL